MVEVATARTTEAAVVEAEEVEALASLAPRRVKWTHHVLLGMSFEKEDQHALKYLVESNLRLGKNLMSTTVRWDCYCRHVSLSSSLIYRSIYAT